ncbi:MAG: ribosome biogenesis GTPase Der [Geobacteraceae bacterium]|nr:ribosome biogenesis GTPase Der [Geobacteraceae bacterium]
MKPIVAIVGRPNVGKSTLFNRLVGRRKAIVDDMPGVTRDRNYGEVDRFAVPFTLIDTGGFEPASEDRLLQQMREQSQLAMEEADVILFVMDARQGLIVADREVAEMLRKVDKPVFFVLNKVEGEKQEADLLEFYALGVDALYPISAEHNRGVDDLMDEVIASFPPMGEMEDDEDVTRIAVVGRPNVGKSSLVNRLLGFERVVANPVPGTTRDSVDTYFTCNKKRYLLIDTAGIRRKGRISLKVEKYSAVDALRSLDRADVALIVINAEDGVTEQDARIAGYACEAGRACILVVNKWDLLKKDNTTVGKFAELLRYEMKYLSYAPILFVSALTGQRTAKIIAMVEEVMAEYSKRITTSELNRVFTEVITSHHHPLYQGRRVKFYYVTQVGTKPPTFAVFTNCPEGIQESYERYLANRFREAFGFSGTPLRFLFRGREH